MSLVSTSASSTKVSPSKLKIAVQILLDAVSLPLASPASSVDLRRALNSRPRRPATVSRLKPGRQMLNPTSDHPAEQRQ